MATGYAALASRSLTPTDFARISLEESGELKRSVSEERRRCFSECATKDSKQRAFGKFIENDYIRVQNLTTEVAGEFFGFSAFFLALTTSCPKFVGKITLIQDSDDIVTRVIKKAFNQSFVIPTMLCHAQRVDQAVRPRIRVETFAPIINYLHDVTFRSERLTQKTLEENELPRRLPFGYQTPEQMLHKEPPSKILEFVIERASLVDLRARELSSNFPRCIEYFENFLRRMELDYEKINPMCEVVLFPDLPKEKDTEIFLTDAFFEERMDRMLKAKTPPRYMIFLRSREWQVDEDFYFVPSTQVVARTLDQQVVYHLKSVTYIRNSIVTDYATLMLDPSGEGFKWTRETTSPSWEGDVKASLDAVADLIEKKDLSDQHLAALRIDEALIQNTDCCIYELEQDS